MADMAIALADEAETRVNGYGIRLSLEVWMKIPIPVAISHLKTQVSSLR